MPKKIIAAANQASLRPITQALVGALEIALDEIASLRNCEIGPWVEALEELMMQNTTGLSGTGADADGIQVAQSAVRACFHQLRAQLH